MDFEFSFIFVKCLNVGEWFEWFECYTFKGGLNTVTLGLMVMVASSIKTKPKRLPFDQSIANCAPVVVKITTAAPRQYSNLKLDPSTQLWSLKIACAIPGCLIGLLSYAISVLRGLSPSFCSGLWSDSCLKIFIG